MIITTLIQSRKGARKEWSAVNILKWHLVWSGRGRASEQDRGRLACDPSQGQATISTKQKKRRDRVEEVSHVQA